MISAQVKKLEEQQKKLGEVQQSLTTDITETRKGGPSAMGTVTELSKLSPKIRTLQNNVNAELGKLKQLGSKVANDEKKKELEKKQKLQADKDAKDFKLVLPKLKSEMEKIESELEAVVQEGSRLVENPLE